jgi:uncharacterized membrane protein
MPKFTRELDELVANNVIEQDVADKIRSYYNRPSAGSNNKLVIAFGIIGALLVGMGVVLIIAHNWDDFSNNIKLAFGLGPMLICQVIAGILVFKQSTSKPWTESVSVILVFATGTAISVVSQVYNVEGSLSEFLITWAILTLPVMYALRSWMASLLFWAMITWYIEEVGFVIFGRRQSPGFYWPLALAALPFYINLIRKSPSSNSISFHSWFITISLTFALGLTRYDMGSDLIIPAYVTMFSVFILIGQLPYFYERRLISNAWMVGGSAGTICMLLFLTFNWQDGLLNQPSEFWLSLPMLIWVGLFMAASALLYIVGQRMGYRNVLSKSYTFIVFLALFVIGLSEPVMSRLLTNVLLLALGVFTIREGALANQLWKMNYGLLILAVLIGCRFFDTDMSFVIRGLLFVGIGVGFFVMNIYMIRKRKAVA